MTLLAGDVGGTNARLALYETGGGGALRQLRAGRFDSGKYPGLVPIVKEFLAQGGERVDAACLAIAGPVKDGVSEATNLPWVIRARELADATGTKDLELVNDFAAVGWGIPHLQAADLATLQVGRAEPRGAIGLIGAGTGTGEGFLVWHDDGYHVHASEGGHGDFAATDEIEFKILSHLKARFGHVSYERVLSGAGIHNIYMALVEACGRPESPAVRAELHQDDPAAVISRRALERTDPTCREAIDRFISIYGAEAGNLALRVFATGGVYVAGGIAPRLIDDLRAGAFIHHFNDKGRLAPMTAQIPVHVILNTQVGLLGAAACAARSLVRTKG